MNNFSYQSHSVTIFSPTVETDASRKFLQVTLHVDLQRLNIMDRRTVIQWDILTIAMIYSTIVVWYYASSYSLDMTQKLKGSSEENRG